MPRAVVSAAPGNWIGVNTPLSSRKPEAVIPSGPPAIQYAPTISPLLFMALGLTKKMTGLGFRLAGKLIWEKTPLVSKKKGLPGVKFVAVSIICPALFTADGRVP